MTVFVLVFFLLLQREVRTALGDIKNRRWRIILDSVTGVLVVVYGIMLISRFLNLLY